jgi:cephalosporin-C deacetylase-like acetyl esterase
MTFRPEVRVLALLLVGLLAGCKTPAPQMVRNTGPWDMAALKKTPKYTLGATNGLVQEVFYEGEPLNGRPTRVFAYLGRPANGRNQGKLPAMLLVHGGGGRAFQEWAQMWAERGYVALAMDTAGQGPGQSRLADGGPDQSDDVKFRRFTDADVRDMWSYHAVAAVVRGHSLLASLPEVDASRVGITGISWGGYLTCIVTGIDDRLQVSVPVYGCGHLSENSVWLDRFGKMGPEQTTLWSRYFDPAVYLGGVDCPILFVNGTTDFAYPLDSYQKSYRAVPGPVNLSVTTDLKHSHQHGWAPREIGLFVDSVLRGGKPLAVLGQAIVEGSQASASIKSKVRLQKAELSYAVAEGPWQKRKWSRTTARIENGKAVAQLPRERPLVCFLTVTDERGATTSSPHLELP